METILLFAAQIADILLPYLLKRPSMAPRLMPLMKTVLAALSVGAEETPEQTAGRQAEFEAVVTKQSAPLPPEPVS